MKKYSTFGKRFAASIIDSFILWPLTFVCEYIETHTGQIFFIISTLIGPLIYNAYFIFSHYRYGATIGKKILGIKVVDISEVTFLSFNKSVIRESPLIIVNFAFFTYLLISFVFFDQGSFDKSKLDYTNFAPIISITWMTIELLTMLTNLKRRAIHDYLAGSVVIESGK